MSAHSMDSLFKTLNQGSLAPVYYFYGPEDVLKDEAIRSILDRALDPSVRDFNFDQRSAGQLDAETVHALCNTLPMLAERRVVLLRDIEAWKRKTTARAEFVRYLAHPSADTVVILVQGAGEEDEDKELARTAFTVRFDALPPERASRWVLHHAGKLGLALEPDAVEHLIRSVGADLGPLASELAKLASLPAEPALTVAQVGELVGVRSGETQWDWRGAVLDDQTGRAVSLLPALLAQPGVSGVKLVSLLGTALIGVGIARGHYDKGLRGSTLDDAVLKSLFKSRPPGLSYREEASRWSRWAPKWSAPRLRAALRAALETDQALKTTTVSDERGLLTEMILRMGVKEAGEGGSSGKTNPASSTPVRRLAGKLGSIVLALSALSAFSAPSASAQTDPRLIEVIRNAQEGQGDSARAKVQRLLAATSPGDTLYPQIIYTQAMVASDAADMRRQLQRVAVEYSSSSWADDALLRLVQLDYASGNLDGAARNLERIRRDYPGSALLPQAAYWAARTYFDQKKADQACRWIADGLVASQGNVELQNQLGYLNQRCSSVLAAGPRPPADSQAAGVSPAPDTTSPLPARADTTRQPNPVTTQPAPTPAPTPTPAPPSPTAARPDTARPGSAPPVARAGRSGPRFRIQVTAVRTAAAAQSITTKLNARGLRAMTVEEGGLYKVRIGDYATKAEALAAVPEIKAKVGGSPFVVAES